MKLNLLMRRLATEAVVRGLSEQSRWLAAPLLPKSVAHSGDEFAGTCEDTNLRVHVKTADVSHEQLHRYAAETAFLWNEWRHNVLKRPTLLATAY